MSRRVGKLGYRIGKQTVSSRQLEHRNHESICVADLTYDAERQVATCVFQERGTYDYFDMSPDVFAEWNNSGSRGTYFNLYVRQQFQFERVA